MPDGALYTPATQSFLRGHHWLESADEAEIVVDRSLLASFRLTESAAIENEFSVQNVPIRQLIPRLYYRPASPPDDFDRFNLMMAEYTRNGVSVPVGRSGDQMAHFETTLDGQEPWSLNADFDFVPRPFFLPLRFAVVNNCLAPGLWELAAMDRAGELYHSWFELPSDLYYQWVALANQLEEPFVRRALAWSTRPVRADLSRLRTVQESLGSWPVRLLIDEPPGYSTQEGRRKLAKDYVRVADAVPPRRPRTLRDLTSGPILVSDFVAPGKYSLRQRRRFDVSFLAEPLAAEVRRVLPRTHYQGRPRAGDASMASLEIDLRFQQHRIVLGNLPIHLLVPFEDFVLHGFGTGILAPDEPAERRRLLIEEGPAPSFAYLLSGDSTGEWVAVNSHESGIEQIFVRTHSVGDEPWWEITITSFERIVDLVKFRVEVPPALHGKLRQVASEYITPIYFSYRDDNLR